MAGVTWADIESLREAVEQAPDDGSTHYQLAVLLMDEAGDDDAAVIHFEKAAELGFQPQGVAYRLSRIYARNNRLADALEQLEQLANAGFGSIGLIDGQTDYDSISSEPRYQAAVELIRAARYPCNADERHHAFDFWLGKWNVSQNGQFAGTNDIQSILGHCVIFEQWVGGSGTEGKSFNYYDPGHDHWRQIWDGGIFYTAETINPADSSITHHKFEFTQNDDGSVRQFWATSTDGKKTWATIWDGHYERQED
jgi:TPR repeat protein